jgi:lipopolysaccharide export LptBFGC system permease protein LptF
MILTRHILREHIAPFFYALVVITGLFLVDFVVQILDSILTKGLPWKVVLELFFLNAAWMLALSIPMSVLVAALMAFGRMSADGEIDAMRSAGMHPAKMLLPGLFFGACLAFFLVWFNDRVLPQANFKAASLREDISRKRPAVLLQPKTMIQDFEGFRIWIGSSDPKTDSMRDLTIFQLDRQNGGAPTLIAARSGKVRMDSATDSWVFSLRDGQTHTPDRDKPSNYLDIGFTQLDVNVPNVDSKLHRTDKGYRGDREMPIEEMAIQKKESENRGKSLVKDHSERIFSDVRWVQSLLELDSASRVRPKDSVLAARESPAAAPAPSAPLRHGPTIAPPHPPIHTLPITTRPLSLSKAAPETAHRVSAGRPKRVDPSRLSALYPQDAVLSGAGSGHFLNADTGSPRPAARTLQSLAASRLSESKIALEQIQWERNESNRYLLEIHKKFSIPAACILFVLIGTPLGILARSGGVGTGASYSMAFFVLYWAGLIGGESLADRGRINGAVAMWAPDVLLLLVGAVLVSRMGRQSQFFRYQWLSSLSRRFRGRDA